MKLTMLTLTRSLALTASILLGAEAASAQVATFDELPLSSGSYWNGSDKLVSGQYDSGLNATFYYGSFVSGGSTFLNTYAEWHSYSMAAWEGWAYSNTTDTTTAGRANEFSAYVLPSGGGYGGSANYGIFCAGYEDVAPSIQFDAPVVVSSAYFTNTTYAYRAVVHGDDGGANYVKGPFVSGDWFKVTVWGFDADDEATTSLDIYLADYRDSDPSNWYALDAWTQFDLSSLGEVSGLGFELSSSDSGLFGMNTPAYFAMDSLTLGVIPEPSALLLLLCGGLVGLTSFRRRSPRGR